MFCGTDSISFLADRSFIAIRMEHCGMEVMMVRREVVISWQTQLESKLKVCFSILY